MQQVLFTNEFVNLSIEVVKYKIWLAWIESIIYKFQNLIVFKKGSVQQKYRHFIQIYVNWVFSLVDKYWQKCRI